MAELELETVPTKSAETVPLVNKRAFNPAFIKQLNESARIYGAAAIQQQQKQQQQKGCCGSLMLPKNAVYAGLGLVALGLLFYFRFYGMSSNPGGGANAGATTES